MTSQVASLEQTAFLNPLKTVSKSIKEWKHTHLQALKLWIVVWFVFPTDVHLSSPEFTRCILLCTLNFYIAPTLVLQIHHHMKTKFSCCFIPLHTNRLSPSCKKKVKVILIQWNVCSLSTGYDNLIIIFVLADFYLNMKHNEFTRN